MQTKLTAKQQKLLMFLCWLVYTMAYLGRFSYNSNKSIILEVFTLTKEHTGLVSTFFFIAYGIGQIVNGLLCKYYPKKYVLAGSLVLSSIINLVIGFGASFAVYKWMWLLNGAVQSVLWTSLMQILGENLDKENLSKAVFAMGTTVAVGTFIIYGLSSLLKAINVDFRWAFIIAAIIMVNVAVVWFIFYDMCILSKSTLAEIRAKKLEKEKQEASSENLLPQAKKSGKGSIIIFFIIMCCFAVVCKMTMDGLQDWTPDLLKEVFGMPDSLSILFTLCLPLVGVLASSLCIFARKYIKNIVFLGGLFFALSAGLILVIVFTLGKSAVPVIICMAFASMFTHCINGLLTSIAPLYLRDIMNSGLSSGLFNSFCYVGSAISGYGLGSVSEQLGWDVMFWLLFGLACFGMVIGLVYYLIRRLKGTSRNSDI